jgi:hypothetical protein
MFLLPRAVCDVVRFAGDGDGDGHCDCDGRATLSGCVIRPPTDEALPASAVALLRVLTRDADRAVAVNWDFEANLPPQFSGT